MIISLNIKSKNIYYKIFEAVKIAFTKLNSNYIKSKGRPRKYSDEQIVACMLYGVKNSIFSLRELEYRIKQLYEAKTYNPFLILADAAYDDKKLFDIVNEININLLTNINMRSSKSIESFTDV